jgi:hypothetical protein
MGNMGGGNAAGARDMGAAGTHGSGSGHESIGKQDASDILAHNTRLSSNLGKLLPNGMTAQQACGGFKNLGQCVAAVHASHNLGIPFDQLKAKMTGTGNVSLGKAIQDLKPAVDAKSEVKKAHKQANQDLNES